MSDHSDTERETPLDLSSPQVVEKYRTACEISNAAMKLVLSNCVPGMDTFSLCLLGDSYMTNACKKIYQKKEKGKKIEKGIAFPTCVSVNEICANFSPLDASVTRTLQKGDLVKVDLGVHIDGFIGLVGHSVVCCVSNASAFEIPSKEPIEQAITIAKSLGAKLEKDSSVTEPITAIEGKMANVLKAAWLAGEVAIRQIHVGGKSSAVTKSIEQVAKEFNCSPMLGVMCHQLKKHVIEGSKRFPITTELPEDRSEECQFEENEVYVIDIIVSTGDGKPREADFKPTVYRRAVERKYILKSQLGRHFMSEVESKFPALPFSLRHVEDERACLVGISEAMRHELLVQYPVLTEKAGEQVAQFKFTVQLLPGGLKKVTGLSFNQERFVKASHEIQNEELKALLATSLNAKKNKKKSKDEKKPDA